MPRSCKWGVIYSPPPRGSGSGERSRWARSLETDSHSPPGAGPQLHLGQMPSDPAAEARLARGRPRPAGSVLPSCSPRGSWGQRPPSLLTGGTKAPGSQPQAPRGQHRAGAGPNGSEPTSAPRGTPSAGDVRRHEPTPDCLSCFFFPLLFLRRDACLQHLFSESGFHRWAMLESPPVGARPPGHVPWLPTCSLSPTPTARGCPPPRLSGLTFPRRRPLLPPPLTTGPRAFLGNPDPARGQ